MKNIMMASLACLGLGIGMVPDPSIALTVPPEEMLQEPAAVMGPAQDYQRGLTVNGVAPTLRSVVVDGEAILAYCIEYWVRAADPNHASAVTGWSEFTGDNHFKTDPRVREQVAWILRHAYPTVELDDLGEQLGAIELTAAEAIAGTQAAIWFFTDDVASDGILSVTDGPETPAQEHSSDNVQAVFDYLTGERNIGLTEQEVQASVTLEDASASETPTPETLVAAVPNTADQLFGPILVHSSTPEVKLQLEGSDLDEVTVLDAAGEPIDVNEPVDAEKFWIRVPAEAASGSVELGAESTEYGYTGRLIIPEPDAQRRFQTIVVVDESSAQAMSKLELTWEQPRPKEPSSTDVPEVVPGAEISPAVEQPVTPVSTPTAGAEPESTAVVESIATSQASGAGASAPSSKPTVIEENQQHIMAPLVPQASETPQAAPGEQLPELARTGSHQTRNILVALGTLAIGALLLLCGRIKRLRAEGSPG